MICGVAVKETLGYRLDMYTGVCNMVEGEAVKEAKV